MPNELVPPGEIARQGNHRVVSFVDAKHRETSATPPNANATSESTKRAPKDARVMLNLSDPKTYQRLQQMVRKICPAAMEKEREDFVQVVMMKLWGRAKKLGDKDPGICASYLFRAANNVVIDEIRKRKREVLSENVEDYRATTATESAHELIINSNPAGQLRSKKLTEAIDSCLEGIHIDRRRAVTLRLQGFSIGEIANQLEWKKKKAENMERRGRENLRDCLIQKGYEIKC